MFERRFLSWNNESFDKSKPYIHLYYPTIQDLHDHEEWILAGRCYIQRKPCIQLKYYRDRELRTQCTCPQTIEQEVMERLGDKIMYFLPNPYPYDVNAAHQVLYFRNQLPANLDHGEEILRQLARNAEIDPVRDLFCMQNIQELRSVPLPHIHVFSTKPLTLEPIVF